MRKKLFKMSLITLIIAVAVLILAYFFFHYVTDTGITLVRQEEAGKPFVANMIGQLGVLFLFTSAVSMIAAFVFTDKE